MERTNHIKVWHDRNGAPERSNGREQSDGFGPLLRLTGAKPVKEPDLAIKALEGNVNFVIGSPGPDMGQWAFHAGVPE